MMKPVRAGGAFLRCILFCIVTPLAASILYAVLLFQALPEKLMLLVFPAVFLLVYVPFRKKLIPAVVRTNGIITGVLVLLFSFLMWVNDGEASGMVYVMYVPVFPVYPGLVILALMDSSFWVFWAAILSSLFAFLLAAFLQKGVRENRKAMIWILAAASFSLLLAGADTRMYMNRPSVRYAGHGFSYMHGWSSTDFADYMVYSEHSKLAELDHPASFTIEDPKEMPVMDGAEACYPLYAAIAKAVYKDIDQIEKDYVTHGAGYDGGSKAWLNGRIVTFTNTIMGFERLVQRGFKGVEGVNLFFGARPSKSQMELAKEWNTELEITPIGKEAFIFFVEPDNPVSDLSADELRKIYHGDIENWSELGGKYEKIIAFQRPEDSGSQTMMQYFMGDVSLKAPKTYETIGSMEGVITHVAQYANEKGALGYSFRYFVEDLNQEDNVKLLSVDGVAPTIENIKNGSYPLTVDLVLVTRKDDPNPNVQKMIDFCLSPDGQELIEKTGYAGTGK